MVTFGPVKMTFIWFSRKITLQAAVLALTLCFVLFSNRSHSVCQITVERTRARGDGIKDEGTCKTGVNLCSELLIVFIIIVIIIIIIIIVIKIILLTTILVLKGLILKHAHFVAITNFVLVFYLPHIIRL